MVTKVLLSCLFAFISTICLSDDFSVRILSCPRVVYRGGPVLVTAEVSNSSGKPITVAVGGQYGFIKQIFGRWEDGGHGKNYGRTAIDWVTWHETKELPADWKEIWSQDIDCHQEAGVLVVNAQVSAKGPFVKKPHAGKSDGEFKAWEGMIKSAEFTVNIIEPVGEDKEAREFYRACLPQQENNRKLDCRHELISKFPTSIYGGYALLSALKGWHGLGWYSTPYENFAFYATLEKTKGLSKMFDNAVEGNEELISMIGTFLKAGREDFPYTDDLRANLAGRLAIQGKFERAKSICEALIEKKSTQEKNCSEFLKYLREKGHLKH